MSVASSTWMLKSPTMISGAEKVVNRSSMSLKSSKNGCVTLQLGAGAVDDDDNGMKPSTVDEHGDRLECREDG